MSSASTLEWPEEGNTVTPYWAYTDDGIYQRELERIWYGAHWLYCGLAVEVAEIGSYRTVTLGERPVVMARYGEGDDEISVVENSCAHRGTKLCWDRAGKVESFTCPYHQWNYQLTGELTGVPFRRGIRGDGGMPRDFDPKRHGLNRLRTEVVNGVVWVTFSAETPSFRDYLGSKLFNHYERMFSGRELRVVGYHRQRINGNWKLMLENNKDPYHAALLHVFFATFGLFRPDQASQLDMDDTGRHACLMSIYKPDAVNDVAGSLAGLDNSLKLQDPRIIQAVKELRGDETVSAITSFPSVILLQQVNSMQARQIVPRGPGAFDFIWTHFGFANDDDEMRLRRIRQANLFGPSGYVSADDAEVVRMAQEGFAEQGEDARALMLMGGREVADSASMATETALRGMYRYYRTVMGL